VKDDNFIEKLNNLHSIIDYDEHKNLAKVLLENNKKSLNLEKNEIKNNIKLNLSNFKKEKLKDYLEKIA
jgi:hypothetical protein